MITFKELITKSTIKIFLIQIFFLVVVSILFFSYSFLKIKHNRYDRVTLSDSRTVKELIKNIESGNANAIDLYMHSLKSDFPYINALIVENNQVRKETKECQLIKSNIYCDFGQILVGYTHLQRGYFLKLSIEKKRNLFQYNDMLIISVIFIFICLNCAISLLLNSRLTKKIERNFDNCSESLKNNVQDFDVKEFKELSDKISKSTKLKTYESIAKTTQMLAHDIRKPFTLLKITLEMLGEAQIIDEEELKARGIKAVEQSMSSVSKMLDDIMEIGRNTSLNKQIVPLESIIETALSECLQMAEQTDVSFTYEFKHTYMAEVSNTKILKAFGNILSNTLQAMEYKGNICFKTDQYKINDRLFLKISIRNSGFFIPEEDLTQLFEVFYSKNILGGTNLGLGLAIAKKIINEHGGEIYCDSSEEERFVEFSFTLPIDQKFPVQQPTVKLPETSMALIKENEARKAFIRNNAILQDISTNEEDLEKTIAEKIAMNQGLISIGIIDDEMIYRFGVQNLIEKSQYIAAKINLKLFTQSDEIIELPKYEWPDILICDIDLGPGSLNGFEIVTWLRENGYEGQICIHSNRSLPEDYERGIKVGAQAFIPKPISRIHLLKFILISLDQLKCNFKKEILN